MKGFLIAVIATAFAGALLFAVGELTKDNNIYEYCDIWFLDCEYCNKLNHCSLARKSL